MCLKKERNVCVRIAVWLLSRREIHIGPFHGTLEGLQDRMLEIESTKSER